MPHAPRAERRRGVVAGIKVDENGAAGIERDRQLEREIASCTACSGAVAPRWEEITLDVESLERVDRFGLGGQPPPPYESSAPRARTHARRTPGFAQPSPDRPSPPETPVSTAVLALWHPAPYVRGSLRGRLGESPRPKVSRRDPVGVRWAGSSVFRGDRLRSHDHHLLGSTCQVRPESRSTPKPRGVMMA